MGRPSKSDGFSLMGVVVGIVIVALVGFAAWYVWQKHDDVPVIESAKSASPKGGAAQKRTAATPKPDAYAGWKTYANTIYGYSFKYPTDWKVEEVDGTDDPPSASYPVATRFSTDVTHAEDYKYNDTAVVEVLNNNFSDAVAYYDKSFSGSTHVAKTTSSLKGRPSVQYIAAPGSVYSTKLYLFDVGGKTYSFRSIDEELNVQKDAGYWAVFDKAFDSFQITK